MIIFGHYHRKISSQHVTVHLQDQQGNAQPVPVAVFQQFIHLFWIPIAPVVKKLGFKQNGDIYTIKPETLPPAEQQAVQQLLASTGTPWWGFSGLVLLLALLAYGFYTASQEASEQPEDKPQTVAAAAPTSKPQVGEVWVLTYKNNPKRQDDFTFARVAAVTADSVVVHMCTRSFTLKGYTQLAPSAFAEVLAKQNLSYGQRAVPLSIRQIDMRRAEGLLLHVLPPVQ